LVKQMSKKVKVAVFDKDQKIRKLQMCDIGKDGSKLRVSKGGKNHFYPSFDRSSFLEWPKPWYKGGGFERIYYVRNHASKCVNFETLVVPDVDLEVIEDAAEAAILRGIGTEEKPDTPFIQYAILGLTGLILLVLMNG